jgi:hypothetical protein
MLEQARAKLAQANRWLDGRLWLAIALKPRPKFERRAGSERARREITTPAFVYSPINSSESFPGMPANYVKETLDCKH